MGQAHHVKNERKGLEVFNQKFSCTSTKAQGQYARSREGGTVSASKHVESHRDSVGGLVCKMKGLECTCLLGL